MTLKFYNTLTKQKQTFEPIDDKNVRMYVCGPTVYDYAHIGNARPIIVFDVLFRLLRHTYGADHVTYVRNITDVDDKINARADKEGISIAEVTKRTTDQFHKDIKALGVLEPTVEPRATDHIKEMIEMNKTLIEKGHAYVAEGHVLFSVPSMKDYGRLSNRTLDEMIAGARVEVASYKKDPTDFVLWKPSSGNEPGWESPWGFGRPGWHIECSAMSEKYLGKTFDIHGGGIDLTFPHHENEIAQSRCAHGTDHMANLWMHNGFLQVEGEKMSKSLGNFITINELLEKWPGDVLRLAMLMTHYRQPIDWTKRKCIEAEKWIRRWRELVGNLKISELNFSPTEEIVGIVANDLNVPKAISMIQAKTKAALTDKKKVPQLYGDLCFLGLVPDKKRVSQVLTSTRESMKVLRETMSTVMKYAKTDMSLGEIKNLEERINFSKVNKLIDLRNQARADKNWAESDRVRDELDAMGVVLKDGPDGTTWEAKR